MAMSVGVACRICFVLAGLAIVASVRSESSDGPCHSRRSRVGAFAFAPASQSLNMGVKGHCTWSPTCPDLRNPRALSRSFSPKICTPARCRGLPSAGIVSSTASSADAVRGQEQVRTFRSVVGQGETSPEEAVKIVSYNVLGPKQALTDKHAYSNFKWRKWPYRKERIFEELRGYDADIVCLQEVRMSFDFCVPNEIASLCLFTLPLSHGG